MTHQTTTDATAETTAIHAALEAYRKKHGFGKWQPRLALFDMDGVLYNSMPNHAEAWQKSMAKYNIPMTREEAYAFEGMRGFETIKIMARRHWGRDISDEESAAMYKVKCECYAACPKAGLIPGVHELQETMQRHGMRIGIVTGSGQHSLLKRILDDFDGLVSPDIMVTALNIKRGKPAPDPYLKGMQLAGTQPWETIVVENAPLGVRAAVAAQCFTVAVNTGPLPDSMLADEGADLVLHDMAQLTALIPTLCQTD